MLEDPKLLIPDPNPTFQSITNPDPDPGQTKVRIRADLDPDPQHWYEQLARVGSEKKL